MSKMRFSKGKFNRFLSSKGFYVALAVCLVGASAATWVAVNKTISGIEDSNNQLIQNESRFSDFPSLEEVEKSVPDVPKLYSPPASSSSTPSSSSAPAAAQDEPSDEPVNSSVVPTLVYTLPVRGTIDVPFSGGELVKNVTLGDWRTHDGIDIICGRGDDIYAVADGVVASVVNDPLWGTVLTISHLDGHESIYMGLDNNLPVGVGDQIMVKQVIGKLGVIPCEIEQESHLHFAMKKDNVWIDPLEVIAKAE